jgi:hypothetical protein
LVANRVFYDTLDVNNIYANCGRSKSGKQKFSFSGQNAKSCQSS